MKIKFLAIVLMVGVMVGLQSCQSEPTQVGTLDFKAVNLGLEDKDGNNISVNSTGIASATVSTNIVLTINGDKVAVNVKHKLNELPARPGDMIEFTFLPSNSEMTEALISLPDGSSQKLTVISPTLTWTVPNDFTSPLEFMGDCRYKTDDQNHIDIGTITIIPIEE